MKKVVSVVLFIAVATFLVLSLLACNNGDKIVGTWKMSNVDLSYGNMTEETRFDFMSDVVGGKITFNSDGTVTNKYGQTAYWKYDKSTKEYIIADEIDDLDTLNHCEKAKFIDGELHIDCFIYKKA